LSTDELKKFTGAYVNEEEIVKMANKPSAHDKSDFASEDVLPKNFSTWVS
jgi:hypothetical protein